jgi:hypothetical protein
MAKAPTQVVIRSYQVGFGDCFLLSFVYGKKDERHVLIDFGTTELAKASGKVSAHMPKVAADIEAVCKRTSGRLTAVVATHRHADHISGFGTDGRTGKSGEIIRALRPRLVLQPWTEDPDAVRDAKKATRLSSRTRKGFVASLDAMHEIAAEVAAIASKPPRWMGRELRRELGFLGQDNIKNRSAVENLIAMGKAKGATGVWAHHGSRSGLERLLPGVKVRVLGPPDLAQTEKIRTMRKTDPDQFWHLLGRLRLVPTRRVAGRLAAQGGTTPVPPEARWFQQRLQRLRGDQLLQIVRILDEQMNNTSLILLFEVFGKKLLFPGDAQIENWSYALEDAPDAKQTRQRLRDVDVYKVGHHGSLNATPRTLLWEPFTNRNKSGARRLKTLLSTMPGKHGKVRNNTEVPRRTLLRALTEQSQLQNTHKLPVGKKGKLCHELVITA